MRARVSGNCGSVSVAVCHCTVNWSYEQVDWLMRVSITGGSGFIGTALGVTLSAEGHDVRLVDTRDAIDVPGMNYIRGSVLSTEDCYASCDGMDVVFHCAAIHQISMVTDDPLSAIEVNVRGTLNLLRAAQASGVKCFVYLSSAKVFGEPENLPSVESDFPVPCDTYALSKATAEYQCYSLPAQSNMNVVIVRPFSVYGPKQNLNTGYVGMILASLRDGTDLVLPGRPDFVRDFIHIDDVVRLCTLAATTRLSGLTILNAGSGQQTFLRELVALAAEILQVDLDARYRTPGPGTLIRMQACMKQAEAMLNFRPVYDLRTGLTETIQWFLKNQSTEKKAAGG